MSIRKHTTHRSITGARAFTLVETLVAVAILMIAIAGPLVIATKGLTAALYSKNQMIASFLAQESMEVVKNIHDNNIYDADDIAAQWLTGIGSCTENDPCDANGIGSYMISTDCPSEGCPVYYSDDDGYTSDSSAGGTMTEFSRKFYLENVGGTHLMPEVQAHVTVNWMQGTIPFEIHLVSTMVAVRR
ncbi:MAG: prepilin-type N-terminal cleavage/methylation domain-containing protein [Candidatus Pacebacteria bacterium]|nr:prepilin-type N-terminal cleavage/methylation domain-containing protein [Candidatus Paceibacterota bacterium]